MSKELFKQVNKVNLNTIFPEYDYPAGFDHAIIDENNRILNFCSEKYSLVHNQEIFLPIEDLLSKMGLDYNRKVKTVGGSKFYVDYVIKENGENAKVGDVFPKISVWNSYDGTLRFRKEFGYYKLICSNGLTSPLNVFETLKKKHSTSTGKDNVDSIKDFLKVFASSVEQFLINSKKDFDLFGKMHSTPSSIAQLEALADEMNFSKKILETAIERYNLEVKGGFNFENQDGIIETHQGSPETLFTVYNALNYSIYNNNAKELPETKLKKDSKLVELVTTSTLI